METPERRFSASEPGLTAMYSAGVPYQWQYTATRVGEVPEAVLRAAAGVKIAVIDTGADVTVPDLAAKAPETYNVFNGSTDVRDLHGHGTFVASIAGGSVSNGEGIAGFGGDAKLLLIQSGRADGSFTDVDEADAIVYAVNHGAKVINLSIGGIETSALEKKAAGLCGRARRPRRGSCGQRVRGRQPGRVPGGAAPTGWLGRTRRHRPLGRRHDEERRPRLLLQHRFLDLARSSR